MRWLILPVLLLLLAAGLAAGAVALYDRPGPLPADGAVVVPHGRQGLAVAALQQAGVLSRGLLAADGFRLAARLTLSEGPVHAGELRFPAHASLRAVLHVLRTAQPVQHDLTIPEGLTAAQIARLIAGGDALSGAALVPAEGGVLPETYAYARNTSRAALLARMHEAMRRHLAEIWAGRDASAGLSDPSELLTLASIVERETAIASERNLVARVFLNRLRLGMRLQSDPTVAYAASGGLGELAHPLSHAELTAPNPYNTYVVAGLPPTPICAPGLAALQAVAHPAASDALYFVADGTGGHAFAADLSEHLRNVARLRAREARAR